MNKQRLYDLWIEVCAIPSVTESPEEILMAHQLKEIILRMEYFQAHAEMVKVHEIEGDARKRCFTTALIRGKKTSPKTVILCGHMDVVGVEEFGVLEKYAYDPEAYTAMLKTGAVKLDPDAQRDLDSGEWLFGRGTMDMKFGIATNIEAMYQVQEQIDTFEGNILFLGVCDEEGNSTGMIGSLPFLKALKEELYLEYSGVIVTEPYKYNVHNPKLRSIHIGSIGKLLPMFYCVGRAGHVSDPYGGLNPNLLVGKIIEKLEQNSEFCDELKGKYTPAPMCLKQADTKMEYTVQTPVAAYSYFNMMTYHSNPDKILEQMKTLCESCFREVLEQIDEKIKIYNEKSTKKAERPDFQPIVLTYAEFYQICVKAHGEDFINHMNQFVENSKELDFRVLNMEMIKEAHKYCPERSPMIIVSFAPPYYPNSPVVEAEDKIIKVCNQIMDHAKHQYGEEFTIDYSFDGISDMSYLNISKEVDTKNLGNNFPLWNTKYTIPLDLIRELALPFLCTGGLGKDAHRYTERLHLPYSFDKAAPLTWQAILALLKA